MSLVLATGGLGFIGSHTCINLINKGYDVLVVDSLINSHEDIYLKILDIIDLKKNSNRGNIFFKKGDLLNKLFVEKIFKENIIDTVVHFAGLKSVEESVKNPLKYWYTNINITINILNTMENYKCYKFIFSSSATIYKTVNSIKLVENHQTIPFNAYGNTKLSIERILEDMYLSNRGKWKIINLRYFNPAGAHHSGLIGENPNQNSSNLFPKIAKVIFGNNKILSVFGNDWPTKDGTCIRDYIHIEDLADAHVNAINFLENNKPQIKSINIGTGLGSSVLDVINTYSRINKIEIPYQFKKRRKGDVPYLVADNKLSKKLFNWYPKKNLEVMCKDSFNFLKNLYH